VSDWDTDLDAVTVGKEKLLERVGRRVLVTVPTIRIGGKLKIPGAKVTSVLPPLPPPPPVPGLPGNAGAIVAGDAVAADKIPVLLIVG
jgi:hypothetical protein